MYDVITFHLLLFKKNKMIVSIQMKKKRRKKSTSFNFFTTKERISGIGTFLTPSFMIAMTLLYDEKQKKDDYINL